MYPLRNLLGGIFLLKVAKKLNDFRITNNIHIICNKFIFILSVVFLAIELKLICSCLSLSRSFNSFSLATLYII